MIRYKMTFLCLVLLITTPIFLFSQNDSDYQELEDFMSSAVEKFEVPGFAVGIIKNGQVVFANGYGYTNTDTKEEVDTKSIFAIASCSKAFTATAIGILVDEGILNWEDKVIDHIPWFQLNDPYITRELTIRDLLCHRSGFQTFDGDLIWYGSDYNREEVVKRIRHMEIPYSLRSKFGYSNIMFITAGEVVKEVSGKTWDEFILEKIFQPLSMNSTSTSNNGFKMAKNIAYPHIDREPMDFINYDNIGAAGSINSSVDDLLKWVDLWLNKGVIGEHIIFSKNTYYTNIQVHMSLNSGAGENIGGTHFFGYGLGWFLLDYEGRKVIQHGGGLPGFHSKVVFVPEDSLGYVILSNEISGIVDATHQKILDYFLRDSDKDWIQLYLDNEKKNEEKEASKKQKVTENKILNSYPSLLLTSYTGVYEDKLYGQAEITINNNELLLSLLPTKDLFTGRLTHWHYDTFQFKFNDPFLPEGYITFNINKDGKPEYFTIELDNPDFHFHKLKFEILKN